MAYDPRATKVSKSVKRVAATILDNQKRREFIRGYVAAERANLNHKSFRKGSKSAE